MFCPTCGSEIQKQSRFCSHCGAAVNSDVPEVSAIPSSDSSASFFSDFGWTYDGPSELQKHLFYTSTIRGFHLWFELQDSSGKTTRADGKATIKFIGGGVDGRSKGFEIVINIHKKDFTFEKGRFLYHYRHLKPVIEVNMFRPGLQLRFKSPRGREFEN